MFEFISTISSKFKTNRSSVRTNFLSKKEFKNHKIDDSTEIANDLEVSFSKHLDNLQDIKNFEIYKFSGRGKVVLDYMDYLRIQIIEEKTDIETLNKIKKEIELIKSEYRIKEVFDLSKELLLMLEVELAKLGIFNY